jgi:hypothetical protein
MTPDHVLSTLALDQIQCSAEFYGVKIAELGEDGDEGFFAFTHDQRRAIAAVYRYLRENGDRPDEIQASTPGWRQLVDNCGCGERCPHDDDHECTHWGLSPCRDDFAWIGVICEGSAPGALAVTVLEVSR